MGGVTLNSIMMQVAMKVLLSPLSEGARKLLEYYIRDWYCTCLEDDNPNNDAVARTLARILNVDVSDIEAEKLAEAAEAAEAAESGLTLPVDGEE